MTLGPVLILALAASGASARAEPGDVPPPPLVFDLPDLTPSPARPVSPPAPAPSPIAAPVVTPAPAPVVTPQVVPSSRPHALPAPSAPPAPADLDSSARADLDPSAPLLSSIPLLDTGFGGVDVILSSLAGSGVALSQVSLDVTHDAFSAGLALVTGGSDALSLGYAGPRVGWEFAHAGPVDFGADMLLGVGVASRAVTGASDRASLVVWQPEVTARARLLPWLRAHASLSYRLANAGTWGGPSGDELGGFGLGIGLDFGSRE